MQTLYRSSRPDFHKKESLAQVFSCQFCEISKNTFFTEHLWTTISVSDSISDKRPYFIGEEKLMAQKCAVPDPENTDDETRLLCSPNDKDTPQVHEESIN